MWPRVIVFIRGASLEDQELADRIILAAKVPEWETVDLKTEVPSYNALKSSGAVGIAFGKVTGRLAKEYIEDVRVLPPLEKLRPTAANASYRTEAWEILQTIEIKDNHSEPNKEVKGDWMWAILRRGEQRICVYSGPKPDVEADSYISREDVRMLFDLKEAFKAEDVLLDREDE